MITLWAALQASSWQLIIAIGRQRGLGLDANLSKSELMAKVAPTLLDPVSLNQAMTRLSAPAGQALLYLCQAGGHCPARYLRQQHGPLRPMSQLVQRRQRVTAQSDLTPFAPLEQLCLLGLAFLDRKTDDLFIPGDLMPLIEAAIPRVPVSSSAARRPLGVASPVDLLCHDLTCFLALLQCEDIAPLHGRWLPAYFLADWSQNCAVPPASPHARSELQTNRRRFLHYLAENAGWVSRQSSVASSQKLAADSPTGRLRTRRSAVSGRRSFLTPAPSAER